MSGVLRVSCRPDGTGFAVGLSLEGAGARRAAEARFGLALSAQDQEDARWYLEDYLQYPVAPARQIAARVEARLAELGGDLFRQVFEANRDTIRLWDAVAGSLPAIRVEVDAGIEGGSAVPWELLRDPVTDGVLALRAGAFVRTHPETAVPVSVPDRPGGLRVLLVICRPGGRDDVPFRSVASHLVRLSREAREAFQLDVLRPPTFAQLTRVLEAAKAAGEPYQVVHFDGHGAWLDVGAPAGAQGSGRASLAGFSLVSSPRPGSHGFLVFEDPASGGNQQLVDGPALGRLLADTGVPVLVLNACRSAHAALVTAPETVAEEHDAHRRVRAYGSLAQEVMDAGVAGVVAMRYNVFVATAARFIGEVYGGLLAGQSLGVAVSAARRQLAASPLRQVSAQPLPLQDWVVPVVYEAAPLALRAPTGGPGLVIDLSWAEAGWGRARLDPALPAGPDAGFFGRDETLLALDRAFDTQQVVLLHAWAGAGKTSTALEFARWYELTGAAGAVLFTSFENHLTLAQLLDQLGDRFTPALAAAGVTWAALDEGQRRQVALQVLAQVPVLWVWDNIEPVAGFPAGTPSAWNLDEQHELAGFLHDLQQGTRCKVLLTSRREERAWLGDLPARVALPPMPMLERLELARAVAGRQTGGAQAFLEVEDWRPLLEFTQGNPLTITILTRQALRDHYTSTVQIDDFVTRLRDGAVTITDDATEGRNASLTASLDYGFTQAFTDTDRAILALLSLFQGFIDVDTLTGMGRPEVVRDSVQALAGLTREAAIALLDRAAEIGLLTLYGDGYYAVHPAIPWHLQHLFSHHYGPPGSLLALQATRAWTAAIGALGSYYLREYEQGGAEVIDNLSAEEANLLRARHLAIEHAWYDLLISPMRGLDVLYEQTGRAIEWRRLVEQLIPELNDPTTGGPLPGREQEWNILTQYRARIARQARDWPTARQLQDALIAWDRQQAAVALTVPAGQLDRRQRDQIRNLAVALHGLGQIQREQDDPGCVQPYQEAMELAQRISDRRMEATLAFSLGNAYMDVPGLRDLDQAERWYQRDIELLEGRDRLDRARATGQLGNIAGQRFRIARDAGAAAGQLAPDFSRAAATYYQQALDLFPDDAIDDLAIVHNTLGDLYEEAGETDRALGHYQRSIEQEERRDNRYGAGQGRLSAAFALAGAGRRDDALLYARAALRDHETAGAATEADQARKLIARIELETPDEPAAMRAVNTLVAHSGTTGPVATDQPLVGDTTYDLLLNIGRHAQGSLLSHADAVWPEEQLPDKGLWLRAALTLDNAPQPSVQPFFLPQAGESFACDCPPNRDHQADCDRKPWTRFPIRTPMGPTVLRGELVIYYEVTAVHAQLLTLPVATGRPGGPRAELLGRLSRTFDNLGMLTDRTASVVVSPSRVVVNGMPFADNPFAIPAAAADTSALNARQVLYNSHFRVGDQGAHSRYGTGYRKETTEFERDLRQLAKEGAQFYTRLFDLPGADTTVSFSLPDLLREEARRRRRPPVLQIVDPAYDQHAMLWAVIYDLPVGGDPAAYELCPSVRELGPGGAGQAAEPPVRCEHEDEHRGRGNVLCPFGFWGLSCILEQPPDAGRDLESIVTMATEPVSVLLAADSKLDGRLTEAHVSQLRAQLPEGAVMRAPVATEAELASALAPESMDVVLFLLSFRLREAEPGRGRPLSEFRRLLHRADQCEYVGTYCGVAQTTLGAAASARHAKRLPHHRDHERHRQQLCTRVYAVGRGVGRVGHRGDDGARSRGLGGGADPYRARDRDLSRRGYPGHTLENVRARQRHGVCVHAVLPGEPLAADCRTDVTGT